MLEVEQVLVDVDLAGVHQEVEVGLEIVAEVEELVDRSQVEGEDQGVASAPEEVASEGEAESIFYCVHACISRSLAATKKAQQSTCRPRVSSGHASRGVQK